MRVFLNQLDETFAWKLHGFDDKLPRALEPQGKNGNVEGNKCI